MLSFASGSAIKRITAGVKARRDRALRKLRSAGRAFTLPTKSASNEKRIHLFNRLRTVSHNFGRFKTTSRQQSRLHSVLQAKMKVLHARDLAVRDAFLYWW
jgi:hypothetical protein